MVSLVRSKVQIHLWVREAQRHLRVGRVLRLCRSHSLGKRAWAQLKPEEWSCAGHQCVYAYVRMRPMKGRV